MRFRNNEVRPQLHALAYNLANFMRTLALPENKEEDSQNERLNSAACERRRP